MNNIESLKSLVALERERERAYFVGRRLQSSNLVSKLQKEGGSKLILSPIGGAL